MTDLANFHEEVHKAMIECMIWKWPAARVKALGEGLDRRGVKGSPEAEQVFMDKRLHDWKEATKGVAENLDERLDTVWPLQLSVDAGIEGFCFQRPRARFMSMDMLTRVKVYKDIVSSKVLTPLLKECPETSKVYIEVVHVK